MAYCGNCGKEINDVNSYCSNCNTDNSNYEKIIVYDFVEPEFHNLCPRCGGEVLYGAAHCDWCGLIFDLNVKEVPYVLCCRHCGNEIGDGDNYCRYCGFAIDI